MTKKNAPSMAAKDYRDGILSALENDDRPLSWLKRKTNIPYGTLYSALIQRTCHVSGANLKKINAVLKTDFSVPKKNSLIVT